MAKDEATRLRRDLASHEKGRGKRYTADLKRRITAYATGRRDAGATYQQVADELGLCFETVRRWCVDGRGTSSTSLLVPVEVITEQPASRIAIVSPSGFRLEGLAFTEAVAALRALE